MPEAYENGAYYWVRQCDDWTIAKRWKDEWLQLADDFLRADGDFDEIGPCIGNAPPQRPDHYGMVVDIGGDDREPKTDKAV